MQPKVILFGFWDIYVLQKVMCETGTSFGELWSPAIFSKQVYKIDAGIRFVGIMAGKSKNQLVQQCSPRKGLSVFPVLGLVLGIVVSLVLPKKYESTARFEEALPPFFFARSYSVPIPEADFSSEDYQTGDC